MEAGIGEFESYEAFKSQKVQVSNKNPSLFDVKIGTILDDFQTMSVMPMHCHYIYGMIDHIVHPSCCRSSWSNLHDYIRNLSKSISVSISTTTNYIFKVTVFFAVGKSVVKVNAFGAF